MKRSTKSSLLMSVVAMLLCISMLVGSTFAWFTDSVTATNNVIVAGNLDVELYYQNDETTTWEKATATSNIFKTGTLWEPGHVEVIKLKVVNEGTLALKYSLGINKVSEVESVNIEGNPFKLSDYIKFGVVEGDQTYTREEAVAAVEATATPINTAFTVEKELKPAGDADDNKIVTVVVYMPETVGNVANYGKGQAVPTVNLGLNVFATQLNYEYDSFDNTYDEGLIPVADGEVMEIIDGVEIVYTLDGEVELYNIPEDYAGDTVIVPDGVTSIGGYAFAANQNIKKAVLPSTVETLDTQAFKGSSVETVVLNEGLTTIGDQAFSKAGNLKNVNIPSTVETIGDQAFRLSGIETLTIPATVETIKTGAFRDMPNLKTVIIEGDSEIGNYAFRSCPVLENVYILGDPTFTGTSQVFCRADNGDCSGITVYVMNDTVLNKVKAANTSVPTLNVVVMNSAAATDDIDAKITSAAAGEAINLTAGDYTITKSNQLPADLTLFCEDGVTITVNDNWSGSYKGCLVGNGLTIHNATIGDIVASDVTFVDCTFPNGFTGSEGNLNLSLVDCTVNGKLHFVEYGTAATVITGTTADEAEYYSAGTVEFNNCAIGTLAPVNTTTIITDSTIGAIDYTNAGDKALIIDGVYYAGNDGMLKTAIAASADKVMLSEGDFEMSTSASNVTFVGASEADTKIDYTIQHSGVSKGSIWRKTNFENLTFTNTVFTMADGGESTFTNVTFGAGFRRGYGKAVVFTECTFDSNTEGYALHFESDSASADGVITLNGCTFNGGKVHLGGKRSYAFTGCEFAAGTDFQVWGNITLDGCTVDGVAVDDSNVATLFPALDLAKVTIK